MVMWEASKCIVWTCCSVLQVLSQKHLLMMVFKASKSTLEITKSLVQMVPVPCYNKMQSMQLSSWVHWEGNSAPWYPWLASQPSTFNSKVITQLEN